jgi:hypothetical protein
MKANRKHQIILNFELNRIAVEQKMRERYFAFEKSLVVAHREKIVSRQKSLGIYRPQTTPDKKLAKSHSFFITAVAMETKARTKLPPVTERKADKALDRFYSFDGTKARRKNRKTEIAPSFTGVGREGRIAGRESLPVLKQRLAVIQTGKEGSYPVKNFRKHAPKDKPLFASSQDKTKHSQSNITDSQPFAEPGGKAECQTEEGQSLCDEVTGSPSSEVRNGHAEKEIENERTEVDVEDVTGVEDNVENIMAMKSSLQTEDKASNQIRHDNVMIKEKNKDVSTEGTLRHNLELQSNLKDSRKDIAIPEKNEETSDEVKSFNQSDEPSLPETRRPKSVMSGGVEVTMRTKVIGVNLRAQSTGTRAT